MSLSSHSKVIIKEEMNSRHIPLTFDNAQPLKLEILISNSILSKCLLHIEGPAESLPSIAAPMLIVFLIPGQYFIDGFLGRHIEEGGMVGKHVNQFYLSAFLSQLADYILLVFPPLDLVFCLQLQIFAMGAVKLGVARVSIDLCPGLSAGIVEPVSNIRASRVDDGPYLLLYVNVMVLSILFCTRVVRL